VGESQQVAGKAVGKLHPPVFAPTKRPAEAARLRPSKGPGQLCGEALHLAEGGRVDDFRFSVGAYDSAPKHWKIVALSQVRGRLAGFAARPAAPDCPQAPTYVCLFAQFALASPRPCRGEGGDLPCDGS
jgi:hypothetical protein